MGTHLHLVVDRSRRWRSVLAAACNVLGAAYGRGPLWSEAGPSAEARELLHAQAATSQRTLLELAFGLWDGTRGQPFGTVLEQLDRAGLRLLGTLLVALADGEKALDKWAKVHGGPAGDS
jgi:hypothetical protein